MSSLLFRNAMMSMSPSCCLGDRWNGTGIVKLGAFSCNRPSCHRGHSCCNLCRH
jgi:hypothetical protein